jgi:hypothetical protein
MRYFIVSARTPVKEGFVETSLTAGCSNFLNRKFINKEITTAIKVQHPGTEVIGDPVLFLLYEVGKSDYEEYRRINEDDKQIKQL